MFLSPYESCSPRPRLFQRSWRDKILSDLLNQECHFIGGFPKDFRKLPPRERLHKSLYWWLGIHVGNTGLTDHNVELLEKELLDILKPVLDEMDDR